MINISISDLLYFNKCRRYWLWSKDWGPKEPQKALWEGTGVHKGLEAFYRTKKRDKTIAAYKRWAKGSFDKMGKVLGYNWGVVAEDFQKAAIDLEVILNHYIDYFNEIKPIPLSFEVVDVEKKIRLPLIEGEVMLTGKIDLVLKDERGRIVLVDHKTTSSGVREEGLEVDQQLTGYAYLWYKLTGEIPDSVVYDIIFKGIPEKPRDLTRGGLSKAKDQYTTGKLYRQALREKGLSEEGYEEILAYFDGQGYDQFFKQITTFRNPNELEAFEFRSKAKAREIQRAMKNPDVWAYPEPNMYNCGYCEFVVPCKLADDGGDPMSVIEARFTKERLY